jgi:hypothetical protein
MFMVNSWFVDVEGKTGVPPVTPDCTGALAAELSDA